MGGRAFVVTQSVKKLSDVLKQAVFNDCNYRLLSKDSPVSIETLKTFDRKDEKNRYLFIKFEIFSRFIKRNSSIWGGSRKK